MPGSGDQGPGVGRQRPARLPAGRHHLSPEDVATSQRQRLLEAFAASCAAHGYASTTVAEIISAAGVSRATFYEQFSEKDECFHAALETILSELAIAVATVKSEGRSSAELIADRLAVALDLLAEKPAFAHLIVAEYRAASDAVQAQRTACAAHAAGILNRCRKDAAAPETVARACLGGAEAAISEAIAAKRGERLPALFSDLVFLFLAPYLGPQKALAEAQAAVARRRERGHARRGDGEHAAPAPGQ